MTAKSIVEANAVLAAVAASTRYLALCTALPTPSDTGSTISEASYTGYARKAVLAADWGAPASGVMANVNALAFAACTGGTSTVVAWALCTAATLGNVKYFGKLVSPITVVNTNVPTVNAATLVLAEA